MSNNRLLVAFLCTLLAGCNFSISTEAPKQLPPATAGTEIQSKEAFEAAQAIVKKLDAGQFDQVWDESSLIMKSAAPKFAFTHLMDATRGKLGTPAPRGAPTIGFTDQIDQNIPKGEYSIVQVDTTFGSKVVTEKVVMVREEKIWKLAGYFMQTSKKFS